MPLFITFEGIEILTGCPAGIRQDDGTWPEGTVNYLVDKRLREMVETIRKLAPSRGGEGNGK